MPLSTGVAFGQLLDTIFATSIISTTYIAAANQSDRVVKEPHERLHAVQFKSQPNRRAGTFYHSLACDFQAKNWASQVEKAFVTPKTSTYATESKTPSATVFIRVDSPTQIGTKQSKSRSSLKR